MMVVGGAEIMLDDDNEDNIHNCFDDFNPVPHQSDSPLRVMQIIQNSADKPSVFRSQVYELQLNLIHISSEDVNLQPKYVSADSNTTQKILNNCKQP